MTRGKVSGTERAMGPASSGIRGIRSFYDEMGIGKEELLRGTGPGGGGRGENSHGEHGPSQGGAGDSTPSPRTTIYKNGVDVKVLRKGEERFKRG